LKLDTLLLGSLALGSVIAIGPLANAVQDRYHAPQNPRSGLALFDRNDPQLGSIGSVLKLGSERSVVIILTSCNSCSVYDIDPKYKFKSTETVALFCDEPTNPKVVRLARSLNASLSKSTNSTFAYLNPTFSPRIYVFSGRRLVHIQKSPERWEEAVVKAEAAR
jgi:hypothetical protein